MLERMLGAIRLNANTFEDVENDSGATMQAMAVVILVSLATGLGAGLGSVVGGGGSFIIGLLGGVVYGLIWWAAWAFLTMLIGTTILRGPETHADWGQLARGTGFAQAPGLFKILAFLPWIGQVILIAASVWQFIAMVIAVRQCLDYTSTWRAVGVVVIAFVLVFAILIVLTLVLLGIFGAEFVDSLLGTDLSVVESE